MTDIERRYREYLACLNSGDLGDLARFVHDPVVHNARVLRTSGFADLLRRDRQEIPDLFYAVERLVVQGDQVACRIRFDCTPAGSYRGIPADGRSITFVEHAFYTYLDGRIGEILSLVDMDAVRSQLGAGVVDEPLDRPGSPPT